METIMKNEIEIEAARNTLRAAGCPNDETTEMIARMIVEVVRQQQQQQQQ